MLSRAEMLVKGEVQKVGYRSLVQDIARSFTLKGYVENLRDGSVKIVCEGERDAIENFVKSIRIEEPPIHVLDVCIKYEMPKGEFEFFDMRYGNLEEELAESFGAGIKFTNLMRTETSRRVASLERQMREIEKILTSVPIRGPPQKGQYCFIMDAPCDKDSRIQENTYFIAVSDKRTKEGVKEKIERALSSQGLKPYVAVEEKQMGNFWCVKICPRLRSSAVVVAEISDRNPNVMLEVGFAYALRIPVICAILANKKPPSNLDGIELVKYSSLNEMEEKLKKYVVSPTKIKE